MPNEEDEKISSKLKGNTLRVYWEILKSDNETIGVREIQRKLKFSSPALASYHITKLEEMGLVVKKEGDYRLAREINVGIFSEFVKLGTFRFPRFLMYSTFFTLMLILFIAQFSEVSTSSLYAFTALAIAAIILWYETVKVWRQKP